MAANQYYNVLDDDLTTSFIEYKELNEKDFKNFNVRRDFLQDIDNKYLSEVADGYIDLKESNTVVINSSVGQGKSVLAIDIAKDYYLQKNDVGDYIYTIIFAAPYKTLVEQYIEKITSAINETGNDVNIPDYANLAIGKDEKNNVHNASSSRMHVITVNCLLGNPGEDAIEQNFAKRDYLKGIINNCVKEHRKVIIIFDEIHDAIHNFQQEFIFNLWRFKTNKILHKTFILSATYNEASKIVIKYIAELTDKNLQILETHRIQQKDNLSNLHIHVTKNSSYGYDFDSPEYVELFGEIIDKHQKLNVLSFSQNLCTNIALGENGKSIRDNLLEKYKEINICIAEENHPSGKKQRDIPPGITYSNKYIPGMCNIGTTFKTGISIEEENSGFVIILPPANAMQGFVKSGDFGVFTNGTMSLIQSIARVRNKSDIYIIMPFPKQYINEFISLYAPPEDYAWKISNNEILKHYFLMDYSSKPYFHHLYTDQYQLISKKYNQIRERVKKEIEEVEKIEDKRKEELLPFLKYPTLDMFILEKGEKYLYTSFAIFGKDLPAYMIWAAFNNQFVNCKLKSLSSTNIKKEEKVEHVLEFLYDYYDVNYDIDIFATYDYAIYDSLYKRITSTFELSIKKNNLGEWGKLPNAQLKRLIMTFIQVALKGNSRLREIYYQKDDSGHIIDKPFEAKDYLLCCMANAIQYNINNEINTESSIDLIKAYQNLYEIYKLFNNKLVIPYSGREYIYPTFDRYSSETLNATEKELIIQTIRVIKEDTHYKHFRKLQINLADTQESLKSIYKELKEVFFNTSKERHVINGERVYVEFVNKIELPKKRTGLNLLYKYEYSRDENYDDEILGEIFTEEYIPTNEELEKMPLRIIDIQDISEMQ